MIEALSTPLAVLVTMGALTYANYLERAEVSVSAVQVIQRAAIGYFEKESPCGCSPDPVPLEHEYAHDFCNGESVMGPGALPPETIHVVRSSSGKTCDLFVYDGVRMGEVDMTLVYRGRSRSAVEDAAGFTVESRLPWLWWTIVARGGGDLVVATSAARPREITVAVDWER